MTLRDLERSVYRRLNKNTALPNGQTQERIRGFLNERHRRILRAFPSLRDETFTFASVASQSRYAIPEQGIARITRLWDPTNNRSLLRSSLAWLREADPQNAFTGTPTRWIPLSYTQVHTQPSNASAVFVDSTSASDTNRCYVEGMTTGGYRQKAEITMTGTTAVNLASAISTWIEIDKFYLSEAAVGIVTLHEDAEGGTELSKIVAGDTYAKYHTFLLYPTPSAIVTYSADVARSVEDLVNPLDEPLLPIEFHDLLAIGARLDEYEYTDDPARRRTAEVEWDEGMKALTSFVVAHPGERLSLDDETDGFSRLGSWFPADTR